MQRREQRNVLMKANTCDGCLVQDDCLIIGSSSTSVGCPCKNCLVKMVCKSVCKDFNKKFAEGNVIDES